MLQVLRDKASSWVIRILLGLLVIAFAIWGINDVFVGERDPAVAKVDGIRIARSKVESAIRDELNRLRPVLGNVDQDAAFRLGLAKQVLNGMVNHTAVNAAATDLGIVASDQMVNRNIRSNRRFQDQSGKFSRALFYQALATANVAEGYYVSSLKQSLPAEQLHAAIASNIPVPSALSDPLTRFRSEERTARTVLVRPEPLDKAREPTEEGIEAYYKGNKDRFMAPEYRDVTFVDLDPHELAKKIHVPEEKIRESYKQRIDDFKLHERRKISQVVFKTEAAARAARAAIKAGKTLAEAAKENGRTLKVVKLGWVEEKDLFTDLAKPVFALKKGQISGVLKSPLGWHIIAVEDSEKGRTKPLSEVHDQLREALALREAQNNIFSLAQDLQDSLAGGADMKTAAAKINVKAIHVPALDRQGRGPDGKAVAELPVGGNFLRTAWETPEGETSDLLETKDGGYYILVVNKVTPSKVKPLKDIRNEAVKAWKAEQQAEAASKRAKAIVARLKKGDKLDAIARDEKLKVKTSPPFTRLTHEAKSGVPTALSEKLFDLKVGEAAMAESSKGYVVGVLTSIKEAEGKDKAAVEKAVTRQIRRGIAADLSQQLVQAFRQRFTIKTYPDLLKDRL